MSFSFCCTRPSKEGFRRHPPQDKKEEEEEESGGALDISELREEYRSSRERQRRTVQVLIYRTVSVELKDAISIIPINQNVTSPCSSPPAVTFEENLTSCDPWMVPLGLHQLSRPRRSLSSSKTASSQHLVDPPSSSSSDVDHITTRRMDLIQSSVHNGPEQKPCNGSNNETPITSPPTSSLRVDLKENWSTGRHTCNSILTNSSSAWRGSRKFSAPSFRLSRQLSVGGLGQNQNFPFPSRKSRRISEAVRRLGMYSSI